MYFDMHIHFFPDFLAKRTIASLNVTVPELVPETDGGREDTIEKLKDWHCCGGLLLSIATNARQQKSVNNFAAESQQKGIYAFGSVFPGAEDAIEELRRIKALGLKGIKFHPDYQNFYVDDEKFFFIYEEIEKLGLPVTFHTGFDPVTPDVIHCTPKGLGKVADKFPSMRIISAHMGGRNPEEAINYLSERKNIWFDTAFINEFLTPEAFEGLVCKFGADRVLFGSDCPWSSVPKVVRVIEAASLSNEDKEKIYYKNALGLLDVDTPAKR